MGPGPVPSPRSTMPPPKRSCNRFLRQLHALLCSAHNSREDQMCRARRRGWTVKMKGGHRPPAKMADIASMAGVSPSTVSRALAGSPLVAKKKRDEIMRLAREAGYVVNSTARNLRLKRTETISVVIPLAHEASQPLTDPFFVEMLGYLADAITQRGYGVLLQKIVPPMNDWLPNLVASGRSDGVIVIGQSTEHQALEEVSAYYRPLVVWGAPSVDQTYCTVGTDNVGGASRAVEHLIRLGRQRIIFFGDPGLPEIGLRYEGYLAALENASRPLEAKHIVPSHLTADTAYAAMSNLLASEVPFDAVFAASDLIALSAIQAITAAGLTVPGDVAVVGFDDISLAVHGNPALTTVRQDLERGARTMVDRLFERLAGEDASSVTLAAELIIRESCGAKARS